MKIQNVRIYQMLTRVVDYVGNSASVFPKNTAAAEIISALGAAVVKLSELAAMRVSAGTAIQTGSSTRSVAREALKDLLERTALTGQALNCNGFGTPRKLSDPQLIDVGHSFVREAEPFRKEFADHGLSIDDLIRAVQDFERAQLDQTAAKAMRSSAIREYDKTMDDAMGYLARLDALVANTLGDNPTALASWNVARKIDHFGGRKAASPEPTIAPAPVPAPTPPPEVTMAASAVA